MTDPQGGKAPTAQDGRGSRRGVAPGGSEEVYTGPPKTVRPPRGWKVPEVVKPAPPRKLPEQDTKAIDAEESRARTLTHGVGILAGSLMFVVLVIILIRKIT